MSTTPDCRCRLITVTHCYPSHGGGIERVAHELVQQFAAAGIEVEWFASRLDTAPPAAANLVAVPVSASNVIERLTQLPYPLWSPGSVPRLWTAIGGADVVHVHEHLYMGSVLAVLFARMRGRPVVITQHMGSLRLRSRMASALYSAGARLLAWWAFSGSTRPVFISANVQAFFGQQSNPRARLIFNGLDRRRFRSLPDEGCRNLRASLGLPQDATIALFVGRFVRKKGLEILRYLAVRHPRVVWVFVGSGPEDPTIWGSTNVRVVGRVPQEQLPAFYQAADLLVLPSRGEGFPLVVQEALACGLGVLTTREVATACPPARALMRVQPDPQGDDDPAAWNRVLASTLRDHRYLRDRDERARQAGQLWSWDRCAAEYVSLFDELRARTPPRYRQ